MRVNPRISSDTRQFLDDHRKMMAELLDESHLSSFSFPNSYSGARSYYHNDDMINLHYRIAKLERVQQIHSEQLEFITKKLEDISEKLSELTEIVCIMLNKLSQIEVQFRVKSHSGSAKNSKYALRRVYMYTSRKG